MRRSAAAALVTLAFAVGFTLSLRSQNLGSSVTLRTSGGVELATSGQPLRIDPVGTTAQPASESGAWSVTANIGTTNGLGLDSSLSTIDTDVKSNITLHAGTNVIGKFGIDQTTPGTTNAAFATNFPATVTLNSGNADASTFRSVIATNNPAIANWGHGPTGSAVPASATFVGFQNSVGLTGLVQCDKSIAVNIVSATTQSLVNLTNGQTIYVCGIFLHLVGAATQVQFALESSAANACTSPTLMSGGFTGPTASTATPTAIMAGGGLGYIVKTPVSNALCALSVGTAGIEGFISYAQF